MSETTTYPTSEDMVAAENGSASTVVTSTENDGPDHGLVTKTDTDKGYTPVFNDYIRTGVYVIGLAAVIVGAGIGAFGDTTVGDYVLFAGGVLASGFGVAYNPVRMNGK